MSSRFSLRGAGLEALPSGALWWPGAGLLVVSDLHFGKSERLARRGGTLLPPYETRATLGKLDADLEATGVDGAGEVLGQLVRGGVAGEDLDGHLIVSDQLLMRTTSGPAAAVLVDRAWPNRLLPVATSVRADPSARM